MSNQHEANFGDRPLSVEQILGNLKPEALEVSREELFFQAGFAAGAAGHAGGSLKHYFWPALAAALLVACVGIGASALHQAAAVDGLKLALAAAQDRPVAGSQGTNVANLQEVAAKPQAEGSRIELHRGPLDPLEWQLRKLATSARMPPGRLTAMGWTPGGNEMGNGEWGVGNGHGEPDGGSDAGSDSNNNSRPLPQRPATYLELLRLEQEG